MKAQFLGRSYSKSFACMPDPVRFLMENLPRFDGGICPGEVDPLALVEDYVEVKAELQALAEKYNLRTREARGYIGPCLLPLAGSTGWHSDPGLGDLLNLVLAVESLPGLKDIEQPELVTRNSVLTLKAGDVFVFNADTGHAWVSNSAVLIAQVPVSKIKGAS